MRAIGVVRKIDELGRVVLPMELRRNMNIKREDPLEILVDGSDIILKKYEPTCIFCEGSRDIVDYKDKNICQECLEDIKKT